MVSGRNTTMASLLVILRRRTREDCYIYDFLRPETVKTCLCVVLLVKVFSCGAGLDRCLSVWQGHWGYPGLCDGSGSPRCIGGGLEVCLRGGER